ncbi:PREDICTED: mast cell-expressed membrane protein 1 isoform X1 [Chinchilla lanigera]|uniref:mast cell-expressed membrane protein 1 isoform X1 n=1 Tax=Chinchilla lanigera TaxID=34839 RepID=UPI0006991BC6|nr:PREDICTED: mast cell-expressed membrane protein 1 isoform X1 [Chinchilla lanigera]
MQAAAFKDKHRGETGGSKDACDPEYENITLTCRDRNQPKGGHPGPLKRAPAQPRSPSDSAQVPVWLQRSVTSLYVFLTLIFLFCIALSALVLVKTAEMSREMLSLKRELSNISNSALECQEEQRKGWIKVQRHIQEVTSSIVTVQNQVKAADQRLKPVPTDITQIKQNTQKILEALEKKSNTQPAK